MKIQHILLTMIILMISFSANAATVRDNYFCIENAASIDFESGTNPDWYSITANQPFEGESGAYFHGYACIDIKAGRKLSTTPKNWVESGMAAESIPWTKNYMVANSGAGTPEELNFAILGTLKMVIQGDSYTCSNIYIGQGSNYWGTHMWLFSNNNVNEDSILCSNDRLNKEVYFYPRPSSAIFAGDSVFYLAW